MLSLLPNLLTLLRITACPVLVVLLYEGNYALALLICIAAGITDGLDGYIAKKFNFVTELGTILDPIADKLLITSMYIMLGLIGDIPFWLLILVIFRDLVIVVGYLILVFTQGSVSIHPSVISKINTFLQILLMILILLVRATEIHLPWVIDTLIILVSVTTVSSGIQYIWQWSIPKKTASSTENESTNDHTT